jgi:hypothetical protein
MVKLIVSIQQPRKNIGVTPMFFSLYPPISTLSVPVCAKRHKQCRNKSHDVCIDIQVALWFIIAV